MHVAEPTVQILSAGSRSRDVTDSNFQPFDDLCKEPSRIPAKPRTRRWKRKKKQKTEEEKEKLIGEITLWSPPHWDEKMTRCRLSCQNADACGIWPAIAAARNSGSSWRITLGKQRWRSEQRGSVAVKRGGGNRGDAEGSTTLFQTEYAKMYVFHVLHLEKTATVSVLF